MGESAGFREVPTKRGLRHADRHCVGFHLEVIHCPEDTPQKRTVAIARFWPFPVIRTGAAPSSETIAR